MRRTEVNASHLWNALPSTITCGTEDNFFGFDHDFYDCWQQQQQQQHLSWWKPKVFVLSSVADGTNLVINTYFKVRASHIFEVLF